MLYTPEPSQWTPKCPCQYCVADRCRVVQDPDIAEIADRAGVLRIMEMTKEPSGIDSSGGKGIVGTWMHSATG